jgi:hypothetical protein
VEFITSFGGDSDQEAANGSSGKKKKRKKKSKKTYRDPIGREWRTRLIRMESKLKFKFM